MTLDWLRAAARPARGAARAHRGHGLVGPDHGARGGARRAPDRRVVVCSEHAHSSIDEGGPAARARAAQRSPVDDAFALRPDALDLGDACAVVATVGTTSSTSVDPVAGDRRRAARGGRLAPRRRRLRRRGRRVPGAARTTSPAGSVPTRSSSTRTSGCSRRWTARRSSAAARTTSARAFSLVPEYLRVDEDVVSLSEYASPLGRRFRALKLWAVLRCFGREGLQAIIREHVRLAALFEGWVARRAGLGGLRAAALLARLLPPDGQRRGERGAPASASTTSGEIFLSHTKLDGRFVLRLAIGNARTTEDDVALAWDVLRREAARASRARPAAGRERRRAARSSTLDVAVDLGRRSGSPVDDEVRRSRPRPSRRARRVVDDARRDADRRRRARPPRRRSRNAIARRCGRPATSATVERVHEPAVGLERRRAAAARASGRPSARARAARAASSRAGRR